MANRLGGEIINNFAGSYCLIRTLYKWPQIHGDSSLSDLSNENKYPLSSFINENGNEKVDRLCLKFFDTETTGLGGTGTVPFLNGVGSFVENGFEIRQYIIPDYSDETAMLEDLSNEFNVSTSIVSYNGAAFDLPILRDRLILNRVASEVKFHKHIDLVHTVRRIYKRRLGDCSLGNVEREILSFYRKDDIPGYLIPSVYFDWLNQENLNVMEAVMEHNRLDILSLAFLIWRVSLIFQYNGENLDSIDDLHSLSKIHTRRKDHSQSLNINRRVSEISQNNLADDILLYNALIYKKEGDLDNAVPIWDKLKSSNSKQGMQANIELAIYLEHKIRDYPEALKCAQKAYKYHGLTDCQKKLHNKRITRLLKKITK